MGTKKLGCFVLAGLMALSSLFALSGCGEQLAEVTPTPTATPVATPVPVTTAFALPYYPSASFHPTNTASSSNLTLMPLVYEGLFELDGNFQPINLLCESYTKTEDSKLWRFVLRGGVTFSDGTPLTAAVARQALLTAKGTKSIYASRLAGISAISAEGDLALTVTLDEANAELPALLTVPIFTTGDQPLGSGPYVLDGDRLAARSGWWRGEGVPLADISLYEITSADDLIYAFDAGEVGLVTTDLTGTNALGYSGSYETWEYQTTDLLYVGLNCTSGATRSAKIRAALTRGFDRATLVGSLLSGHGVEAALPVHPYSPRYDKGLADTVSFSLNELADGFDSGGYYKSADGLRYQSRGPLKLTLVVNTDNGFKVAVAEQLAETLGREGITVTLKKLAWEDYVKALEKGNFDLYLGQVRMTADFDPTVLVATGGALNYGGYANKELNALLKTARETGVWTECYTLLLEEAPIAPLCFKTASVLTQWGRVNAATPMQGNVFYGIQRWSIK